MTVTVVSDGLASLEKVMLCSPSGAQKGPKVFHVPQKDLRLQRGEAQSWGAGLWVNRW